MVNKKSSVSFHRALAAPFFAGLLFSTIGCGYTKGYLGPELPPEKISRIEFTGTSPITLSGESVDTVPVDAFKAGIDVLPGKHIASSSVSVEANEQCGRTSCDVSVERDKDGYVKNRTCTCTQQCDIEVYEGNCSANFSSAAGRQYSVRISPAYGGRRGNYDAEIEVLEGGVGRTGKGDCSEIKYSRTRDYEKSVPSYDCNVGY